MKLILASASPRRAEVLRDAGIAFETCASGVDESPRAGESPKEHVERLARAKARATAGSLTKPAIVVAADTEVVVDGEVLGKPASADDACRMLRLLSGRAHRVITALAVLPVPGGALRCEIEETRVTFCKLEDREIDDYVASGEPFDKAGAYAIQGRGGRYITRIEGCYFNVVGMPLARLYRLLGELGWKD